MPAPTEAGHSRCAATDVILTELYDVPGEDGDEALRAGGKSTSLDFLLDTLMDMSVAALVCSTSSADAAAAGSLTPKGWPTAMRSPSKRCGMHAAQDMATVPSAHIQPLATVQGP